MSPGTNCLHTFSLVEFYAPTGISGRGRQFRKNRAMAGSKLILDCDTANEIDDWYAIVHTLRQDKFEVFPLNSAQWFHYEPASLAPT